MTETPLEEVIHEGEFVGVLQTHAEAFFELSNSLRSRRTKPWNPKHYYQLIHRTNELESFLDDFGARYNRSYHFFTELVASLRAFAQAGYSLAHLSGRLSTYGIESHLGAKPLREVRDGVDAAAAFIRRSIDEMLEAAVQEGREFGLDLTPEVTAETTFLPVVVKQRLPRNVDAEEIAEEEQRIAEVASKYMLACEMLGSAGIRPQEDASARRRLLASACTEERARVYEATVHNLQSAYDTYIKNTVLESTDSVLPVLRGLASTALHLLEAVTFLTHFYERHEEDIRTEEAKVRIGAIVDRSEVQDTILNRLLWPATRVLVGGREVAQSLLSSYTNAQELEVELAADVILHARPASLIVGIVNHHGTPVEMELAGHTSNAASILELLLAVGSHPDERRFLFRGDARPLHDLRLLFQHGLGERGLDDLPGQLDYLRQS